MDATITILQGAGFAPDIAPLTDHGGRFALDGLPPGDWRLGVHGPNGESGEASVRISAGTSVETTIEVK